MITHFQRVAPRKHWIWRKDSASSRTGSVQGSIVRDGKAWRLDMNTRHYGQRKDTLPTLAKAKERAREYWQ